jgi:hypothetical protein
MNNLPTGVLGWLFGFLDVLEVVRTCWTVCRAWRVRMHAESLYLTEAGLPALKVVQLLRVTHLKTHVSIDAEKLCELSQVKALTLVGSGPTKLFTKLDKVWPSLQSLEMGWFKPMVLDCHWHLPELRHLDLDWTDLSGADLSCLYAMPHLERLSLLGTKLRAETAHVLGAAASLTSLDISRNAFGDSEVGKLAQLVRLQELFLRGLNVTDSIIQVLAGLPQLRVLDLTSTKVRRPNLAQVASLKTLLLVGCSLEGLSLAPGLQHLDLRSVTLETNDAVAAPTLKSLDLFEAKFDWTLLHAPEVECVFVHVADQERATRAFLHWVVEVVD